MDEIKTDSARQALPARFFTTALAASVIIIIVYALHSWNLNRKFLTAIRDSVELTHVIGRLILLDEGMTMSARLAAATGDPAYSRRYETLEPQLHALTAGLRAKPQHAALFPALDRLEAANGRLISIEKRALALSSAGKKTGAAALLASPGYLDARTENSDAVRNMEKAAEEAMAGHSMDMNRHSLVDTAVGSTALALACLIWFFALKALRGWLREARSLPELLRDSEEFKRLFLNGQDVFYRTTLWGKITEITPSITRYSGFSREDLIGRQVSDMYQDPADRAKLVTELLTKGEINDYEIVMKTKNGAQVYVSVNAHLLRGPAGLPIGTEGSLRDITARKRAEAALNEQLARMKTILQTSPAAIVTMTTEGVITGWNPAAELIFGWAAAEVLGKHNPVIPAELSHESRSLLSRVAAGETVYDFETRRSRKNGSPVDISFSAAPLPAHDGSVKGALIVAIDVTGRRSAEETLLKSKKTLSTLLGNLPGVAYRCRNDATWTMEFISEGCRDLTGYEHSDLLYNTAVSFADLILPEDRARVTEEVRAAVSEGRNYEMTYRLRAAGGELKWVWEKGRAVPANGGTAVLEGFITDISEKKRAEEELSQAQALLKQAQKMEAVGRLAGGVAHDFNNLLTAILGYAALLRNGLGETDPRAADAAEIARAAARAADLTRQLLAFSRRQVLTPQVVAVNDVISGAEKMLRRLIGEKYELDYKPGHGLKSVKVDPGQLEQVIMNLALNARDAMPGGGRITIETSEASFDEAAPGRHDIIPPGEYARVTVTDSGAGMDPETLTHIFEPFFTTKEAGKGTGLGLSTVYGIVKQSGGFIWAYSEPGLGTTFKVYLPALEAAPAAPQKRPASAARHPGGTILIAEDEVQVRNVMARILSGHGYKIVEAGSGEEAVGIQESVLRAVDLLLTDVVMPGMNGRELGDRLRKVNPRLKIIYTSGYSDIILIREGLDAKDPFLQKPVQSEALLEKVRELLG